MLKPRLNSSTTSQLSQGCESEVDRAAEIAYEMAYGLSHELNNPLANIAGRARLLAERETDPDKRQQLAIIVDQAMRGCEMIADLMLFARPPAWSPVHVDLRQLLGELCDRARSANSSAINQGASTDDSAHRGIDLYLTIDDALTSALTDADRPALGEALWAVLRNAREVARSRIDVHLTSQEQWLLVTIADDGPGLSEHALAHAFHPYFSGREAGRGLGLGLSKAQRIISLCGGNLSLENIAPTGCRVVLRLPTL